jgi:hypothetical protein
METVPFNNPTRSILKQHRMGRCYELAGLVALHNPSSRLIHGVLHWPGKPPLKHGWVQLTPETVWEPALNRQWPTEVFESLLGPIVIADYDNARMLELITRTGHWGPY